MRKLTNLKCISRVGVGIDSIDIKTTDQLGIKVLITPDAPAQSVAELSVGLSMNLLRHISLSDRRIRTGLWKKEIGFLLHGKTVGVLGLGRIGKKTALLYKALGCNVLASDKFPDIQWADDHGIEMQTHEYLLQKSDIISIHIPGAENGKAVIAFKELSLLKEGSIIINLSRGGVIDEEDLYNYLKSNPSSYSASDVFIQEPYSGPLTELDNIVLTPHLGTYAKETKLSMEIDAVNNLINYLNS